MATYTVELREFIESFSHYQQRENIHFSHKEKIEMGRKHLFDFDYPIFDEKYRKVFETHFIRKFYMREIGFETMGLFKFQLETWLVINMPYFNKLFESEMLKYDPLTNAEMSVTHTKKNDKNQNDSRDTIQSSKMDGSSNNTMNQTGSSSAESKDDNFARKLETDNPDKRLTISANDGQGIIEYASGIEEHTDNSARNTKGNTKQDSVSDSKTNVNSNANQTDKLKSDINEVEDFVQHRVGKIGVQSYPKMIQEYRDSLIRIENRIFEEMQELFMLVY